MALPLTVWLNLSAAFAAVCLLYALLAKWRRDDLPPGPRGTFFTGPKLPRDRPWLTYLAWSKTYAAPLISFRVYTKRFIVLNSREVIHDLLDKRANIYSDRPIFWMYNVLCQRGYSVFNVTSTDGRHRRYRKLLQSGLGARAVDQYWPILESEIKILLRGFAESPQDYVAHLRRNSAAVILKFTFGHTVTGIDDEWVKVAEECGQITARAMAPGRWLVDYFPLLRFIPPGLPGSSFKRQATIWRARLESLTSIPHEWVKAQMASEHYTESFTSRLLRPQPGELRAREEDIKWCAGGLYSGASDTTVAGLLSFLMLMALHPDVQDAVQRELDTELGPGRMPHVNDFKRLHYLRAVMQEVLRFAPIAPLALPHKVTEEDMYEGYRIPKGATVVANVHAMLHDPVLFPNPGEFSPKRFYGCTGKGAEQIDPVRLCFGFGRRTCPAGPGASSPFAETALILAMASIMSQFSIQLPDPSHKPEVVMTTGITSHIKLFDVRIMPRTF